jgi:CelD/BcsL family acetyltransferase involved in cellulose biosynthesis
MMLEATHAIPDYKVSTVRRTEDLGDLRDAWRDLQGDFVSTDPDHYLAVLEESPNAVRPHVVLLEHDGRPEAMIVARIEETRLPLRLGYGPVYQPRVRSLNVVYGGFLARDPVATANRLVDELLGALSRCEADVVFTPNLAVQSPEFVALTTRPSALRRSYLLTPKAHWRLVVPASLDELIRAKPQRSRSRIRRYPKRFLTTFEGRYRFEVVRDAAGIDGLFADVEKIAQRTYQRGLGVGFVDDVLRRRLAALATDRGWYRGYVLYVDDEPCAYWLGLAYGGVFRTGPTGYDPAFAEYNVGTFVLMQMIDDLAQDPDVHTIDYGFGDAEYKHTFGTECWDEADCYLFAAGLRGIWLNTARTAVVGADRCARRLLGSSGARTIKRAWRNRLQQRAAG